MIDLSAVFGGHGIGAKAAKPAGQGGGIFGALMAALKSGDGEVALPEGAAGLIGKITGLIEGAEQALAVPDLSDAEIGNVLEKLVEDLATLIATQPQVTAQLKDVLALAVTVPVADTGTEPAPRLLAETLPALRQAFAAQMTDAPAAMTGTDTAVTAEPETLAPLLTRIVAAVAEKRPGLAPQVHSFATAPVAPVVSETPSATPTATVAPVPLIADAATRTAALPDMPLPPVAAPVPVPVVQAAPVLQVPPAPPMPVEPREVLAQVKAQVGEQGRIRVELRPDGLGAVEIDLAPDEAGQLRVVVRAENPAVLAALRGDRDGLLTLLRGAGHDVQDGGMSFGGFTGQGREGHPDQTGQRWSPVLGATDSSAEETTTRPALVLGGVDMTV